MKKAIITGGSSGLGHEIVLKLLEKSVKVINLSRTPSKLDVINIKTNLNKDEDIIKAINTIKKNHQDIDLLILNSGMMRRRFISETTLNEVNEQFAVNVTGAIKLVESLINLIKKNKGDIVIIGSTSSFKTAPEHSIYSSAKHALLSYIESLQLELKKEDVRIIGFHPGGFKSKFHIKAKSDLKQEDLMDPQYLAQLIITALELPRNMQISKIIVDRKKHT
ncbi:MAG: SDR family oxidoreductase [Nanoarchaeota archaeon]|nr:SDR family oxidoreductase [Nanoarchaeota archaeon]MBU1622849.1 SDR family oxidoreductase [Nanoarchaeota archaeon]MBU1973969.1 SDR family oxidoreductase [Nanoarchaeota archaeon]